jgi:hypothetical protein
MRTLTTLCGLLFAACLFGQSTTDRALLYSDRQKIHPKNGAQPYVTTDGYRVDNPNDSLIITHAAGDTLIAAKINRYQLHPTRYHCYIFWLQTPEKAFALEYAGTVGESAIMGGILNTPTETIYFFNSKHP